MIRAGARVVRAPSGESGLCLGLLGLVVGALDWSQKGQSPLYVHIYDIQGW